MDRLIELDVVLAWHIQGPSVELHLTKPYLDGLAANPWFMAMTDVHTNKMPVFALRWFLGLQSGRKTYKIGLKLLAKHLCLNTTTPAFVKRCVEKACEHTGWADVSYDGEFFVFKLTRRGAVPIWSLRSIVQDSLSEGA